MLPDGIPQPTTIDRRTSLGAQPHIIMHLQHHLSWSLGHVLQTRPSYLSLKVIGKRLFCLNNRIQLKQEFHKGTCKPLLYLKLEEYGGKTALKDQHNSYSYRQIFQRSLYAADLIVNALNVKNDSVNGERIAYLCSNDITYVSAQMGTWIARGVGVPLSTFHPPSELLYFLKDSGSKLVITDDIFANAIVPIAKKLDIPHITLSRELFAHNFPGGKDNFKDHWKERVIKHYADSYNGKLHNQPALIIYTSGTTGSPKVI